MMNYNQKDIIEQELMLCIRKKKIKPPQTITTKNNNSE